MAIKLEFALLSVLMIGGFVATVAHVLNLF